MVKLSELRDLMNSEFLTPKDVKTGDVLEIVDEGRYLPKNESPFGRPIFQLKVRLPNGEEKYWTVNKTTLRRLMREYGDETKNWIGKKVRVEVTKMSVRGVLREVIFGFPVSGDIKEEVKEFIEDLTKVYGDEVEYGNFEKLVRARGLDMTPEEVAWIGGCKIVERGDRKIVILKPVSKE